MIGCDQARLMIHLYIDGELSPEEILEFENHLMECERCRIEYHNTRTVVDTVRGARPLYEIPAGSLRKAAALIERHGLRRRRLAWFRAAAAALVLAAAGGLLLWRIQRSTIRSFAAVAAQYHLDYEAGRLPLEVTSRDPEVVSGWLRSYLPFHVDLPDYPVGPGQHKPYRLVGARRLAYGGGVAAYLAYEMDGQPISLLMSSNPEAAPSGGELYRSGRLIFHFIDENGLRVISWTDKGLHYSLVSELGAGGAESCAICHGSASGRRFIDDLQPDRRN